LASVLVLRRQNVAEAVERLLDQGAGRVNIVRSGDGYIVQAG